MPSLSWNTITDNARMFARNWATAASERAEKQLFYNEFFAIFGISLRTVASFEEPVRQLRGTYGFIDLLWKGKLLVEHKSAGASLEAAEVQAFDYIQGLLTHGRGDEVPRYILLSDFKRFALYDLEPDDQLDQPLFRKRFRYRVTEFPLADLPLHVRDFAFIPGYQVPKTKPQVDLNLKAVAIMAGVHDTLKSGGFTGHDLERFLVRILFCLFGDKTGIFQPDSFRLFIENRTAADGSNLGAQLNELFATLDKPEDRRQRNLDEDIRAFPYVNGALFAERLDSAAFTGPMRQALLTACDFRWDQISPAIFGALFQEVMNDKERRKLGAHYTSERDILKVIRPLFLDKLREDFASIKKDRSGRRSSRLEEFRVRLTSLKFLDPACGCGNFLVIAYRELRKLELEVLQAQHPGQQAFTLDEVSRLSQVDVHQFYGIEIEEWPARIAEVALWLMDHQANRQILEVFDQPFVRLPLKQSPHIRIENALRMDWNSFLPASECNYVMGNPPFVGAMWMSEHQHDDVHLVANGAPSVGVLDYVSGWYFKAADYIQGTSVPVAFVSTNSITQGEQVALLWKPLFERNQVEIAFAYRTFPWESEARGAAHVHVVIVGFISKSLEGKSKLIYEAQADMAVPRIVANISPYLFEGPNDCIANRTEPLCDAPRMSWGSQPRDGGNFILSSAERAELLLVEPGARKWIRPYMGGRELVRGEKRWCLWLVGISPSELQSLPSVQERVDRVRTSRLASRAASTRRFAETPTLFAQIAQPTSDYLAIPEVSSERRVYIPMQMVSKAVVCSNKIQFIPDANLWLFGVLTSLMHMAWTKQVCGRMKSDVSYSNTLVYNNFPWPQEANDAQRAAVERDAQAVLDARSLHPEATLATLYDPLLMPPELTKVHRKLDRTVERCYRPQPFTSDRERVEFLFKLYERISAPLLPSTSRRSMRTGRRTASSDS